MRHNIIEDLIQEELKKTGGNVSQVARRLQLPYHTLIHRYGPTATTVLPIPCARPKDIRELGRDDLKPFVIAIKRRGGVWPEEFDEAIKEARRRFDAGSHEMCQTHNQGWVVQYCVPRQRPAGRRRFFESVR